MERKLQDLLFFLPKIMITRRNLPTGISTTDDQHLIFVGPYEPVSGNDIRDGEIAFSLDSANDKLVVRARYGGALMCGTVSLSEA